MMRAFDFSRRYLPVAALAVLLAGCAVGPDYQRPEAVLPGEFTAATSQCASNRASCSSGGNSPKSSRASSALASTTST